MQMGLLLPPHGLLLMTMKGVAPPQVTMLDIFRAVVPYLVMSVLLLALVFFVPAVADLAAGADRLIIRCSPLSRRAFFFFFFFFFFSGEDVG